MKPIDDFVDTEKKPDSKTGKGRAEAMTLEEMAVKAQERKILGEERKIDMNIIIFVSLCLCGLVIINVVLYFLVGNSKSQTPSVVNQDARGLLEERRKERETLLAGASNNDIVDPSAMVDQLSDSLSVQESIQDASESSVSIENSLSVEDALFAKDSSLPAEGSFLTAEGSLEVETSSGVEGSLLADSSLAAEDAPSIEDSLLAEGSLSAEGSLLAEGSELINESIQDSAVVDVNNSEVVETAEQEVEEIPFDVVISVGSVINDWSSAWSAQDVDAYIAYYADSFVSEAGMNIEEWRAHRQVRLTKPEWISIGIDKLKIVPTEDGARAEFVQEYNASNYSDKELKKMLFKQVNGEWKIFDERATPVK